MAAEGLRTIPDSARLHAHPLNDARHGMKPRPPTIPDRPHPPRLRKAPGVPAERYDYGTEETPPRKRRVSKTLALSILAHVMVLLGASYWVIARHTDAPPVQAGGAEAAEIDPFPMMQRAAPESSASATPSKQPEPLAIRPLPEPELPQLALEAFANHAAPPSIELPSPMFLETPTEISHAKAPLSSKNNRSIAVHPRTRHDGGAPKAGKGTAKTAPEQASDGVSGGGGGGVFGVGQLDGKPRLLHHPAAVFPAELVRQGATSGTVVLDVMLDEDGTVHVLGTISATSPALVAEAQRVAAGSSFTPPTHAGKRVKAHMKWPIVIRR